MGALANQRLATAGIVIGQGRGTDDDLVIAKQDFNRYLTEHPSIGLNVIRYLVDQIRTLNERVGTLALRDVYGRVVVTLQEQAGEEDGRLITGRLTQQDLAGMVGSSREMISRIFKDLKLGGYIDVENKRIIIRKPLPARW